ncbi:Spy/CpxP family protein refolding chaperone [Chitinivorax sp. B]|uniref:periplasmic heavy metal sensor n=1 Tax=Chitinivorax sp. B TaxID=2502235 RepID=UPI0010F4BD83|nr:Spy/CpxP family protein refolding chaperone [Chitinivorax sp. B]
MAFSMKRTLLVGSLVAGIAGSALAWPGPQESRERSHGPHLARVWHVMDKAKDRLNLSTEQAALWQTAENASKAAREKMKASYEKMRVLRDEQAKQTVIDLAKLESTQDELRHEVSNAQDHAKKAWLSAYASLTNVQKEQVSTLIKLAWSRAGTRHHGQKAPSQ